jgi:hypothetical protein
MAPPFAFNRLVRFENENGGVKYGEVAVDRLESLTGSTVEVYSGSLPWDPDFKKSDETDVIHKVGEG